MLKTYEECVVITEATDNFVEKKVVINGYNISIFSYFLATYDDFIDNDALELRGLTFVEASSGHRTRFLHLHKFFNVNQVESTQVHMLKDKIIVDVRDKADGSMITFITLPDGTVHAKTKMTFESDQAVMAQKLFDEDKNMQQFVHYCYGRGLHPVFELTSPYNKIVLNYPKTELQLLQIRNSDGKYLQRFETDTISRYFRIPQVNYINAIDLEVLMERAETLQDVEGWVIRFSDGQMIKIKTKWYFELHGLLTNDLAREDFIIKHTLEETIDDVMSEVPEGDPRKAWADDASSAISLYMAHEAKTIVSHLGTYNGDRKEFAIANKGHKYFGVMMNVIGKGQDSVEEDVEKYLVTKVLKDSNGMSKGKDFLLNEVKFIGVKV